ncbi:hypothetical protein IFM89_011551 [Coptis chinensis]|uniref:SSD domain-containing protein n=1 Tax=Coptis chinensis TaxID=261450 RepID=A0A835LXM2_9MAGN|nr:hypothetical protein IFM89_011551 [Coptis chinensis]
MEMDRKLTSFVTNLLLLQAILVVSLVSSERSDWRFLLTSSNATISGVRHSNEYCAMYDICGKRSDGKTLNCPYGSPSVKPDDVLSSKIQSLCPTISGNVCCTDAQFEVLRSQVQQAIPFLVGCPACLRNFLNLFCELSCSPNQSQYINLTSVAKVGNNSTVDGIDFYVTDAFGEELYNSCKDVKFGTMNTRAMEFIGAGAKTFQEWFAFIGRQAALGVPGSPYSIKFLSNTPQSSGMKPMNVSVYSCSDTSLGCSCGDCPSVPICSSSAAPPPKKHSCSIRIGSLRVKCIEFSLAIVYGVLVFAFFGWGVFHRRKRIPASRMNVMGGGEHHSLSKRIVDSQPMQMSEDASQVMKRLQLPRVQGYMSSFYRRYGLWVARNPTLVLCLSLAVVLLLCLGLIRFKVETQPEKLWVGHGSKASEEKQFFDTNLAPFYRIEQASRDIKKKYDYRIIGKEIKDGQGGLGNAPSVKEMILVCRSHLAYKDVVDIRIAHDIVTQMQILLSPLFGTSRFISPFRICSLLILATIPDSEHGKSPRIVTDDNIHLLFEIQKKHYTSATTCMSAFQGPLDPTTALGGFSGNNYSEASAFVITYPVNNEIDQTSNGNGKAVAWEKAFIHLVKEELITMVQSHNLTLSFSSESSVQEELKRESTADVITILISYIVMFAYISLTLGDAPQLSSFYISSKVLLGLSGVLVVMLSVLGSVGFFSAIGVKSTLIIMEVIPFLVLAVGVDNMCILVHAVKRQSLELPLEERISSALVEVGPSITLASISEVLAFAVGSFIPMPACRVFSMFAALAVLLDFLLQVTAFVALIVFDFLRTEDHRIDCFPCIKTPVSSDQSDKGSGQREGLLTRYMKEIHSPILGLWGVKIVVIAVFIAFGFASIALCTRIQPGLEQKVVLPQDSYLQVTWYFIW